MKGGGISPSLEQIKDSKQIFSKTEKADWPATPQGPTQERRGVRTLPPAMLPREKFDLKIGATGKSGRGGGSAITHPHHVCIYVAIGVRGRLPFPPPQGFPTSLRVFRSTLFLASPPELSVWAGCEQKRKQLPIAALRVTMQTSNHFQ